MPTTKKPFNDDNNVFLHALGLRLLKLPGSLTTWKEAPASAYRLVVRLKVPPEEYPGYPSSLTMYYSGRGTAVLAREAAIRWVGDRLHSVTTEPLSIQTS